MMPKSDGSTPILAYLGNKIARRKVKGEGGKEFEVDEEGQRVIKNDKDTPGSALSTVDLKPKKIKMKSIDTNITTPKKQPSTQPTIDVFDV